MSTMKFCRKCNNILYKKEDREHKILLYACCYCELEEVADNSCVYRNEIHHSVGDQTQALQVLDPNLPRTKSVHCSKCKHGEAAFSQEQLEGEVGLTLKLQCCSPKCGFVWRE